MAEMKAGYNWNGPALTPELLEEIDKQIFESTRGWLEDSMVNIDMSGIDAEAFKKAIEDVLKPLDVSEQLQRIIDKVNGEAPSIITCPGPSCGKENDAGVKSCWWCGGKL